MVKNTKQKTLSIFVVIIIQTFTILHVYYVRLQPLAKMFTSCTYVLSKEDGDGRLLLTQIMGNVSAIIALQWW
jgi:hypothetical protein